MKDTTITGLYNLNELLTSKYEGYNLTDIDTVYSGGDTLYNVFLSRVVEPIYPSDTIQPCEIKPFDNRSAEDIIGVFRKGYSPTLDFTPHYDGLFIDITAIFLFYVILRFLFINSHCWKLIPQKLKYFQKSL